MLDDILGILLLVGLGVLFAWLASRALRNRRAYIKWPGLILSGLLALAFVILAGAGTRGFILLEGKRSNPVSTIAAATIPTALARGEQLANGCGCHSPNAQLPLSGSPGNFLEGGPPMGVLYAPNLTPAGPLKDWTDGEIVRAIREGVAEDGRSLVVMPSNVFRNQSDEDVAALVGYLRSQPAVEVPQKPRNMNLLADVILGLGVFAPSAQHPVTGPQIAPPAAADATWGKYVASINSCSDCHGAKLDGVPSNPFAPHGPSLIALAKGWQAQDFINLFRKGVLPGGAPVPEAMPWKELGPALTDMDIQALHAYLRTL